MLSDFGCCCSQRKCKQLNFACGFSHIEETLKHSLNLCVKVYALMTEQLCLRICFKAHMWKSSWSLVGADPQPSPPSSSVGPDDSWQF